MKSVIDTNKLNFQLLNLHTNMIYVIVLKYCTDFICIPYKFVSSLIDIFECVVTSMLVLHFLMNLGSDPTNNIMCLYHKMPNTNFIATCLRCRNNKS